MKLPDFLESDADGEVRIVGHRIRLIDVTARYAEGLSPETILLDHYPTLNLSLIHKVIGFYLEHQPEVDGMIAGNIKAMAELEAKTLRSGPSLDELRRVLLRRIEAPDAGEMSASVFESIRNRVRRETARR